MSVRLARARVPLLFAAILLLSGSLCAQGLSNRRAPSFSLPDSTLKQYDILDYRGGWLLLGFVGTDSAESKNLSKKLESAKGKLGPKVAILSVLISPPETQATAARYAAETKITTPILFDSGQVAIAYFKATPQKPTFDQPHLFAINPNGLIVKDWSQAAMQAPEFIAEVSQLMAGSPAKK
jgi:peroxiredoxin